MCTASIPDIAVVHKRQATSTIRALGVRVPNHIADVALNQSGDVTGGISIELLDKFVRVGDGDLDVTVGFAKRNDEIGDLGRSFNHMVQQLRESREEMERQHRTQMSRAEHLATLGELAAGLAHEIRNPLAGIAGVIEIVGRDLPVTSPAHAVVNGCVWRSSRLTTFSPNFCKWRVRTRHRSGRAT